MVYCLVDIALVIFLTKQMFRDFLRQFKSYRKGLRPLCLLGGMFSLIASEHDVSKACIWKPAGAQWKARIE